MKKLLLLAGFGILALTSVLIIRTLQFTSKQTNDAAPVQIDIDTDAAVARFAEALTFQTVSFQDRTQIDSTAFRALHDYIDGTYPLVHQTLTRETVSALSLLYTWQGRDPSLEPILLMGHLDVVPVIPGTEGDWSYPPFGGVVADGFVWGRGAMDDKISVLAILESVEALLADGFRPARTIYLAFGHDEEVGGANGAAQIANLLAQRGVAEFAFVLDEGGAIVDGLVPGVDGAVALIGIAEKGGVNIELRVEGAGGHSSAPPPQTTVGILSRAITRLETNPFPVRMDGAGLSMFEYVAPQMSFGARMALANLWLFKPVVTRMIAATPEGAAMLRTTTAATIFNAGVKSNVLPITATALVNFRIIPGETIESVTERVRDVIGDERVQIANVSGRDPSPVSDPESAAFQLLATTVRQVVPGEMVVSPYLVIGGTDARYYSGRSRNVYRFLPTRFGEGDMARVHGTDERLAVESFGTSVKYFYQLIQNTDELTLPRP